jgi:hypothetical protein
LEAHLLSHCTEGSVGPYQHTDWVGAPVSSDDELVAGSLQSLERLALVQLETAIHGCRGKHSVEFRATDDTESIRPPNRDLLVAEAELDSLYLHGWNVDGDAKPA